MSRLALIVGLVVSVAVHVWLIRLPPGRTVPPPPPIIPIVETELADMDVEPSQGSHFFHNLISFGVSYFTVRGHKGEGKVDWKWLKSLPVEREESSPRSSARTVQTARAIGTAVHGFQPNCIPRPLSATRLPTAKPATPNRSHCANDTMPP